VILELIRKEFLQAAGLEKRGFWPTFFRLLLRLFFVAALVAIEVYMFLSIDRKIEEYSSYGTLDFLVLFLFVFMAFGTFLSAARARKVFFDRRDSQVSTPLPIESGQIVVSKIVYVYLEEALTSLVVATPLLIVYGSSRSYMPYYYVWSFLYPFIITFFSVGISLILVIPFEFFHNLIKDHPAVQFFLGLILVIVLCFVYKWVLELFLMALSDSSIGGVFDASFIETVHLLAEFLVPVRNYVNILTGSVNAFSSVFLLLGSIILNPAIGVAVAVLAYTLFIKRDQMVAKKKPKALKKRKSPQKPFMILMKKEFLLLFAGTDAAFSYASILVMIPFLSFLVLSSLKSIVFSALEIFTIYFPELVTALDLAMILFFVSVSVASVSLSIAREGKCLAVMKTHPASPFTQLLAKLIPPFALSTLSLIVSLLALAIGGVITAPVFFMGLFLGLSYLCFSLIYGLLIDMRSKRAGAHDLSFLVDVFSLAFPTVILAVHALFAIYSLPAYGAYLIEALFGAGLLLSSFLFLKKRLDKAFYRMEVQA